ncbi:hypothetical protein BS47DRAFT_1395786 [Hydnum rufescens UP504]|uniref:Uncharacterized protein n=1 Tax=Hydnum rufescens UP504 TaxID=1448309 RepID=A0A9P6DQ35_9AGAM|nr:hypothetical protein BS47DRAFT_1395786 [Hydnum rufescens UP504]
MPLQEGALPSGGPIKVDPEVPLAQSPLLPDDTAEFYSPMDLDPQDIKIPISNIIHENSDQLSISYETYDGGGPHSDQWCAVCLCYLQILLNHLPDVGSIVSQHDYLGSTVFTSYKDWWQSFGVDSLGDFLIDDIQFGPAFKDFLKAAFGERHVANTAVEKFSPNAFESVR